RVAGVPRVPAAVLSRYGLPIIDALPHRFEAPLATRALTQRYADAVAQALGDLDAIRVGALWAQDVLRRNGVPEAKLHLIRPGVNLREAPKGSQTPQPWATTGEGRPLRMIYWGRLHRSKGIHTVLEALALRPRLRVEFAIFGDVRPENPYSK